MRKLNGIQFYGKYRDKIYLNDECFMSKKVLEHFKMMQM